MLVNIKYFPDTQSIAKTTIIILIHTYYMFIFEIVSTITDFRIKPIILVNFNAHRFCSTDSKS